MATRAGPQSATRRRARRELTTPWTRLQLAYFASRDEQNHKIDEPLVVSIELQNIKVT